MDEKMEVIEDKMEETGPKVLFTGIGAEVQSLYQKPNDERWRKLPAQTKDKAKAYRFVPKEVQDEYYIWLDRRNTGRRWAELLIVKLIDIAWDMWEHRNHV